MKNYFDLLILTTLTATILPAVFLLFNKYKLKNSWEMRHPKITNFLASILFLAATCLIYASFIEPKLLVTNYQTIDLPNIDKPIKIAFISDFQVGPYKKEEHLYKIIKRIKELQPDIVLIGGDQIMNDGSALDEYKYLYPLRELAKTYPTYAIHGNHEYGVSKATEKKTTLFLPNLSSEVENEMKMLGVHYMTNDLEKLNIKGQEFYLFGGDSWLAEKLNFEKIENIDKNIALIALIHNPAVIYEIVDKKIKIDLMLSGHTHGGQVRLPFLGPIGKIETHIPAAWYQGLNEYGGIKFFVTSGTGETGARVRFLNPPEIAFITIE